MTDNINAEYLSYVQPDVPKTEMPVLAARIPAPLHARIKTEAARRAVSTSRLVWALLADNIQDSDYLDELIGKPK